MKILTPLFLLLVGCATQKTTSPVFSGGNGKSHEDAIVIHQRRDDAPVRAAVESWLCLRYSGSRISKWIREIDGPPSHGSLTSKEYRQVTFITATGEQKTVYFDVTDFVR